VAFFDFSPRRLRPALTGYGVPRRNQIWPFTGVLREIWPGVTEKKRVFVFFAEEPTVLLSLAILFFSEGSDIAIVHLTPLFFHVERSRDISECSSVKN